MMIFKKSLKSGQASLEYFILFGLIVGLTIASLSSFFPKVLNSLQGEGGFFQVAAGRIIQGPGLEPGPEPEPWPEPEPPY